ncbi:hypothetical protein CCACVL1_29272 [Corchorus capsularis]|uniref:Uncharacterized protein n=1 Tax=Corchorus capsularis TaxID=210143 RepID=A0A1R3G2P5_COCAP|nr:hypothetical protein CCACVL1_29272 [Corchorus capsularis]
MSENDSDYVESEWSDDEENDEENGNQYFQTPEENIGEGETETHSRFSAGISLHDTRATHSGSVELSMINTAGIEAEPTLLNTDDTQIRLESQVAIDINSEIRSQSQAQPEVTRSEFILPYRICRVREEENERANFTPRIVSIGPNYYKKRGLEDMEAQKFKYLNRIQNNIRQRLLEAMRRLERETRNCYLKSFNRINSDDFVNMMLADGCFIIQLFRLNQQIRQGQQVINDPIFGNQWIISNLRLDLLMLENQLPFFVLQEIFSLTANLNSTQGGNTTLNQLALQFFESVWPSEDGENPISSSNIQGNTQLHLLALFHSSFINININEEPALDKSLSRRYSALPMKGWVYNAERLRQAGLRLLEENSGNLLNIGLQRSRLRIPTLFINARSKIVLKNFLAYEQSNSHATPYFASLVMLFYSLIDTPKDVQLLRGRGILRGGSRNGEEVVALFSSLSKDIVLDPDDCLIAQQVQDINRHCKTCQAWFFTFATGPMLRILTFFASGVVSSILFYQGLRYVRYNFS